MKKKNKADISNFLDFSDKEMAIINTLKSNGCMRPTDIAKTSSVKRTTVNYNLKKLQERGVVTKIKNQDHNEWRLVETGILNNKIESVYKYFNDVADHKKIQISEQLNVNASTGTNALKNAYEELLQLNEGRRIYTIEGKNLNKQMESFDRGYIVELQDKYKEAGIIFEGIISKATLESFKELEAEFLARHMNRLTVIYVVNNSFVNFDMHIIMYENKVNMVNFEEKLVLSIKNKFIKQTMFSLYQALKHLGKKVQINKITEKQLRG